MQEWWNVMDFVIVLTSIFEIFLKVNIHTYIRTYIHPHIRHPYIPTHCLVLRAWLPDGDRQKVHRTLCDTAGACLQGNSYITH